MFKGAVFTVENCTNRINKLTAYKWTFTRSAAARMYQLALALTLRRLFLYHGLQFTSYLY